MSKGKLRRFAAAFFLVVLVGSLMAVPMYAQADEKAAPAADLIGGAIGTMDGEGSDEGDLITAFTYTQAQTLHLIEEMDGNWVSSVDGDGPEDGADWFCYDYTGGTFERKLPAPGDTMTITRASGEQKTYVFGDYENGDEYESEVFYAEDGERFNFFYYFKVEDNQSYANQWKAGTTYDVTIRSWENEELTATAKVAIDPNPVKAIEFVPVSPYSLIEGIDGEITSNFIWDEELDEQVEKQFFMYRWAGVHAEGNYDEGDKLIVTRADGTTATYVFSEDDDRYFINEDDDTDRIDGLDVDMMTDQAWDNVWAIGDHSVTVSYMGRTCEVPVEVVEDPIDSIEYIYAGKTDLVELNGGWYVDDEKWNEKTEEWEPISYYKYYVSPALGDMLTVTGNGASKSYELRTIDEGDNEYRYYVNLDDPTDMIPEDEISMRTDQDVDNMWDLGEHQVFVEYGGHECAFSVSVVQSPVESISFTPSSPFEFVAYYDADESGSYSGNVEIYSPGNILTVNYNDGRGTVAYEYKDLGDDEDSDWEYVDSEGNLLEGYIEWTTNEDEDHPWTLGADGMYVNVKYLGKTWEVPVSIVPNPVEGISYEVKKEYKAVERVDGWQEDVYDEDDNPTGESWFCYGLPDYYADAREYDFHFGDRLTVDYIDGTSKTYTYGGYRFYDDEGNELPSSWNKRLETTSDQAKDNQWGVGVHSFTLEYMGATCEVPFEVVADDIESISYEYAGKTELQERIDGQNAIDQVFNNETHEYEEVEFFLYDTGIQDGDVLVITMKDGDVKRYCLHELEVDDEWDRYYENIADPSERIDCADVIFYDGQSAETPWEVGDHVVNVTYMNKQCSFNVKVVPNPIASISYEYAGETEFYEGVDGFRTYSEVYNETTGDYEEVEWTEYCPSTQDGDKITITYADLTKMPQTYERRTIENPDGEWDRHVFVNVNDPNDEISASEVFLSTDESYESQWGIGPHELIVSYMNRTCTIPVSVIENPIEAIEYEPVSTSIALDEENAYEMEEYGSDDEVVGIWKWYDHSFRFRDGDKLTVTDKAGAKKTYVYDSDAESFLDNGAELVGAENHYVSWVDDQSYENQWSPSDSSNAHVYVTYMGKESGPVSLKFGQEIEVPWLEEDTFIYNGKPQVPTVEASEFYTISAEKQTDVGAYAVVLTCNDGYIFEGGTTVETLDWWIDPLEIEEPEGRWLTYNGKAQVGVPEGEGYTLTGNVATKAGEYTALAACDSNHIFWSGESRIRVPYEIVKAPIKSVSIKDQVYKGAKNLPAPVPTVKSGTNTLKRGTDFDYTITYNKGHDQGKYVGVATVKVKGKGNYTGTITKKFKVTTVADTKTIGAKLTEVTLSAIEKVKSGKDAVKQPNSDTMETIAKPKAKTMTVKWKNVAGATNYIVGYKRSTDKAWSYVTSGGKTEYTFANMTEGSLLEFRVAVYDGKKFARGEWTRINCRFYREMVSLKATTGKGKISLNWGKVTGATGYEVLVATKKDMSDAKVQSVEGGSTLKCAVTKYGDSKLKAGTTYYVKVRPVKTAANAFGKKNTYVGINSLARTCKVK